MDRRGDNEALITSDNLLRINFARAKSSLPPFETLNAASINRRLDIGANQFFSSRLRSVIELLRVICQQEGC